MVYFLFLLLSLSSWAMDFPQVGNHARYLARHQGKVYEMKKLLISYDDLKDSYLAASKVTMDDEILFESLNELPSMWFYTPEKILNVLKTCVRREGARETLLIAGQKIEACTFHNEDAQLDYSLGMVPFGQVRFQEYLGEGAFLDFELVEFY